MKEYAQLFKWIESQEEGMVYLLTRWASINTHTSNLFGIQTLSNSIASSFSIFDEEIKYVYFPSYEVINNNGDLEKCEVASALTICKRPQAKKQMLFVCHMDTVFPKESIFQNVVQDGNVLKGPGVADAKGGIVVMLKMLEAIEQSLEKEDIGWKVILNADEEIGSPGSAEYLMETAKKFDVGFVFEPCLPNGNLVGERKGSGNFTLVVRGKSAHAGRHPEQGRNAIVAMAKCVKKISGLHGTREGLTVNVGIIQGGTALNVVPDLCVMRFNVRMDIYEDQGFVQEQINKMIKETALEYDVEISLHGAFFASPKVFDPKSKILFEHIKQCGKKLEMDIQWQKTGGVCDGNRLAKVGLPTVDTMGVRGGGLHSDKEYMEIDSLVERVKLMVLSILEWRK